MAKKKDKPKKRPVSPDLLAKLAGSVRTRAFPETPAQTPAQTPAPAVVPVVAQPPADRPLRKPPNRTDKFQLVVRIPDELAEELRDGAHTARESQTDIVERAIKAELGILRSQFPQFLKAPPPKNTRKI